MRTLTTIFLLAFSSTAFAAGDPKIGKGLHDKKCTACHAERFGGDGSKIYTRPDRIVKSKEALRQRVAMCNTMIGAGFFPEEEEHVAAWLNQQFYKFK